MAGPDRPGENQTGGTPGVPAARRLGDGAAAPEAGVDHGDFYRALFEQSPVPKWVYDRETLRFLDVNAAALAQYGYTRDELLAMKVTDIRPAEDVPRFLALVRDATSGPRHIGQWRHLTKSGAVILVDVNWTSLVLAGRPSILAVLRDVTEQARVEATLRAVEARFEALVQNAPIGVNLKDTAGRYLYINAEGLRTMRLDPVAYVGRTARELFEPAVAAMVEDADRKLLATGKPLVIEVDVPRPAEYEYASMLVVRVPVRDETGAIVALGGFVIDISKQKQAERALSVSEQRFSRIVDLVQEGIWIHDEGVITYANPAAARLFGAGAPGDLVGRTIFSMLQPEDRRRAEERTRSLIDRHMPLLPAEMRIQGLDGKERVAELQAVPLRDGDKVLAIASGRDVTAQRRAERQLQQAVKMEAVGQLTGGVAHDFNNLLTVIIGSLDLDLATVPEPLRAAIDQAMRAAERGAALTHRLLAFSRQQTLLPGPVDFNRLVVGMDDLLRRTLGEQVEIELHLAADLKPALADAAQVENALLNLAINARDAMPDGGKLLIETGNQTLDADYVALNPDAKAGDFAMLAVSDTGTGMRPEVLAHAFEPFFTTKEVGKGSGLGLAMIYGFARQSGGHARIYSEVGHGTTVRLYLPRLAEASSAEVAAVPAAVKSGGGETILVVEDDAKVRKLALAQLESLGYRAVEAGNGKEALAIVESGAAIDLLFTDVVMPGGMTGLQLAEAATRLRPRLRVLFTSGYAEGSMQHRGAGEPGIKLLSKPYRKQLLAQKIREALDE